MYIDLMFRTMKLGLLCGIVPNIQELLPFNFFHWSDENGVF